MSGVSLCESTPTLHQDSIVGQLLDGRYQIVDRLARGGFGQTYIALDTRRPGHPKCVVKQLNPLDDREPTADAARQLFHREAETLEALGHHDQIPQLLAHFEENQTFYLVQEFIAGQPLSAELQTGKHWQECEVLQLLQDVLHILQFVHDRAIIHRDIKPDNLIRRRSDNTFVLVDFGAVKQAPTLNRGYTTALAISSGIYTPPEQMEGNPRPSSDLYALGMTAIQTVTGLSPADLQLQKDAATGELAVTLPGISAELTAVLQKMVRYYFKERYQTAAEVLAALQSLSQPAAPTRSPQPASSEYTPTRLITPVKQSSVLSATATSGVDASQTTAAPQLQPDPLPSVLVNQAGERSQPLVFTLSARSRLALLIQPWNCYASATTPKRQHRRTPASKQRTVLLAILVTSILTCFGALLTYYCQTETAQGTIVQPVNPLIGALKGHTDAVRTLAYAPISAGKQLLVSGSADYTLKVWDLQTGQPILTKQDTGEIVAIAFSPDGRTLASSSEDQTIKLWNLQTGELLARLNQHYAQVNTLTFSPDGQTLVSGNQDGMIEVWNLRKRSLDRSFSKSASSITSVVISSDNAILASGTEDNTIKVWDLHTGKLLRALKGHSGKIYSVTISSNNSVLISSSADGTIKIWNLYTGELLHNINAHTNAVRSIVVSPDGRTIASGSSDCTIKLWDLWTGQLLQTFSSYSEVNAVAISPDGRTLTSSGQDGTIKLWQMPQR